MDFRPRTEAERAMAATVISWYRDAGTGAHRQHRHGVPAERDVLPIVRLIHAFKDYHQRSGDPVSDEVGKQELTTLGVVYGALHTLLRELPKLRDIYERGAGPRGREVEATRKMLAAVRAMLAASDAYARKVSLSLPPSPGRQPERQVDWIRALLDPILAAWRAAGRTRIASSKSDAVITILCMALHEIDGLEREPGALKSTVRRLVRRIPLKRVPE